MPPHAVALVVITLGAAIINGALGYGFSSITVPLALLFLSNRVLNPALVIIEVPLNAYVLFVNRSSLPDISGGASFRWSSGWFQASDPRHAARASRVSLTWLKLYTYTVLLPLILFQAAGFRRPIRAERSLAVGFGGGVGLLYSVTTISGPPLAIWLNNQGLRQARISRGAGVRAAGRVVDDRGGVPVERSLHPLQRHARALDCARRGDWRAGRRAAHSATSARDVSAHLHEL